MYNIINRVPIDISGANEATQTVMESCEVGSMFESVTVWQANDYTIDVRVGGFISFSEAKAFGNKPAKLIRNKDRLVLLDYIGNILYEAVDTDINISKLKESSIGKLMLNPEDYEEVVISIADFGKYSDLRSFGSLAYGVNKVSIAA